MPAFRPARALVVVVLLLLAPWPAVQAQGTGARTALIIGISRYADPAVTPLRGVEHDMASARAIARAMGVPETGMRMVRNAEATKAGLLAILRDFGEQTREGTRALVYFSGHGTRYFDPGAGGCVEGLLTYDGQVITNAELAQATQAVGRRADKLVVMLDACHSEGVLLPNGEDTRGFASALVH
ncbi:MAG: caspase family protein [bacterium]